MRRIGELRRMAGPVTLAVLGVGARGSMFSSFAERFPDRAHVVAVADTRAGRRDALAGRLGVAAGRRFGRYRSSWASCSSRIGASAEPSSAALRYQSRACAGSPATPMTPNSFNTIGS